MGICIITGVSCGFGMGTWICTGVSLISCGSWFIIGGVGRIASPAFASVEYIGEHIRNTINNRLVIPLHSPPGFLYFSEYEKMIQIV
jgi:hypothetical protein